MTWDELLRRFGPQSGVADRPLDVVGLGQNSVDHLCQVDRVPLAGEKLEARDYRELPGGQVATAMLAAQRLGLRAGYIGAVGDDPTGRLACSELERAGLRLWLQEVPGGRSQLSLILVDCRGERTIVESYDPRVVVTTADLRPEQIQGARALHLDVTDVPAAIWAARCAREAGVLVSLDIDRLLPGVEELWGLTDLLLASEGLPPQLGCDSPEQGLRSLRQRCPGVVGVTLGERGALLLDGDEPVWAPAFQVPARDTTGCGDVYRGALLTAILEGEDIDGALRFAAAAAALQAGALGAQAGVPHREEVQRLIAADPIPMARHGRPLARTVRPRDAARLEK